MTCFDLWKVEMENDLELRTAYPSLSGITLHKLQFDTLLNRSRW